MKCVLVSFFNSYNIGDVLIADTLYTMVSKKHNVEKLSYSGDILVNIDKNQITTTLNQCMWYTQKNYITKILNKFHLELIAKKYSYRKVKKTYFDVFEDKIHKVDALIIGGGNMIFDIDVWSCSAERFNKFVKLSKKYDKKVFVISIGIGPFKTERQEIEAVNALVQCDYITFRDEKSYEIYKKYTNNLDKVFVSIDPAFLLPYTIQPYITDVKKIIGLNVFNNKLIGENKVSYNKVINEYAKLAEALSNKLNVEIILFSTELSDYVAVYDVYNKLKEYHNIKVKEIGGIDELLQVYSNLSILIGTRMHSMIIAFTQHIPIIGLSWQQKVEAMFHIIESEKCLFKYNELEANMESIIACCEDKLINLEHEKKQIEIKLRLIREKAKINETILSEL